MIQFTKNKQTGKYDVIGLVDEMKVGRDVTVTKADGTTTVVVLHTASKPFTAKFGPNEGKQVCIGAFSVKEDRGPTKVCWKCDKDFTYYDASTNHGDWENSYCGCLDQQ